MAEIEQNQNRPIPKYAYRRIGRELDQFLYPNGVSYSAPTGNLVVCDCANHRVRIMSPSLAILATFGKLGHGDGEFSIPCASTVSTNGHIFISDQQNHRVQVFDDEGKFLYKFGSQGSGRGELDGPRGLAYDEQGDLLYVVDCHNYRIQVFRSDGGTRVGEFGRQGDGPGEFVKDANPWYVALSPSDVEKTLAVSDIAGNLRFYETSTYAHLKTFKSDEIGLRARGVAYSSDGDSLVVADDAGRLVRMTKEGDVTHTLGSQGDGQLETPRAVALLPGGDTVVTEWRTQRIQVFGPECWKTM